MKADEYAEGLRAAADWINENDLVLDENDLDPVRTLVYCTSAEEFAAKVALLGDDVTLRLEKNFVKADRTFGPFTVEVYTRVETALTRDDRTEWREVQVGEWQFVEGLEHLNARLPQDEKAAV